MAKQNKWIGSNLNPGRMYVVSDSVKYVNLKNKKDHFTYYMRWGNNIQICIFVAGTWPNIYCIFQPYDDYMCFSSLVIMKSEIIFSM